MCAIGRNIKVHNRVSKARQGKEWEKGKAFNSRWDICADSCSLPIKDSQGEKKRRKRNVDKFFLLPISSGSFLLLLWKRKFTMRISENIDSNKTCGTMEANVVCESICVGMKFLSLYKHTKRFHASRQAGEAAFG